MRIHPGSVWSADFGENVWRLRLIGNTSDGRILEHVATIPFAQLIESKEQTWLVKQRCAEQARLELATRLHEMEGDCA